MTHHSSNGHVRAGWLSRLSGSGVGAALVLTLGLAALTPAVLRAQTGTVQGRVTQTGARPIVGAQVTVVGTNLGTTTGEDGRFTLLVPAGQRTVRVLAIGYKVGQVQITVTPGGSSTANAELTPSVLSLDEVVVTGTGGSATKRELGSSVSAINLAAEVKDPPASMDQLLQARTAGLMVSQTGAAAGAGATIRLRGVVSVNQSNQPIIYVDGIRTRSEGYVRNRPPDGADFEGRSSNVQSSPLNEINPADIERIEIIKGAAAATLYGTEASAGVIQIFTKKGTRGQRPHWNLEVGQGVAQIRPFGPWYNPYLNMKPRDSVVVATTGAISEAEVVRALDASGVPIETPSAGQCHQPTEDPYTPLPPVDTSGTPLPCDWARNGYRQRYTASVTGGFDQMQYFVSGGYEDDQGILPQDYEKRLSTRGNFSMDISDNVRLEWNAAFSNTRIRNTPSGNNAQGLILNVYRWERNYRSSANPFVIDSLLNQELTSEIGRLITGGSVYYTPASWFTNRFTIGYDNAQVEHRNLRPFGFVSQPLGILSDQQARYSILTFDYAGNVDYGLSPSLRGTFSFGGQSVVNQSVATNAFTRDFSGPGDPVVSSGASYLADEDRLREVNAGFFFQNVFKVSDRYFLTLGSRFDGNSAFGESLGLQAYPKAALSYVLSDESFWPEALGEAKLRAAMGVSGRAPGAFDKLRTWASVPVGGVGGVLPDEVGDTLIGPEKTREIEAGADLGLFNNKLSVEFTYYNRVTSDALFNIRQVPSSGFLNSRTSNVGKIGSKGMELSLNLNVFDAPNFGLELGGSMYTNSSRVLSLCNDDGSVCAVPFAAQGGWVQGPDTLSDGTVIYFPIAGAKGINIKNKTAIAEPDTACVMGTTRAEWEANGKQLCASDGLTIFGQQQPTSIFSLNTTLRLPGNITLSTRGEYQRGGYTNDQASGNALSRSVLWPTCTRAYGILLPVAQGGLGGAASDLTAWERHACISANHDFDIHYYKADFFKLRDLTLSVPLGTLMSRVENATLRLSVQNYWRWYNDDLRVLDPELTDRNSISDQGRAMSEHVPPPATLTASLRINF
jgi:TonB-linked SusC/RagA family outer membrane protein